MSQYLFQLRRGWKDDTTGRNDWAEYEAQEDHMRPMEGELVLEYDNGIPRLKIGDGIREFSALPYMSVDSFILATPTTITLEGGDAWVYVDENRYAQDITDQFQGKITVNSKIDLQPTPEQLAIFHNKDLAFVTENEDGVVTVYVIGQKPESSYTMQTTVTEVTV